MSRPAPATAALVPAAVALVVVVAALLGLSARATYGARTTADEPYYLLTAISLADDGSLDISDELTEGAYRPFHEIPIDPQTTPLDADGTRVSPHDPLLSVLLAVPVAVGGWVGAKVALALLAGMTAALTAWVAIRRHDVPPLIAGTVVAGLFAGMPLAPYGTQVYPEMAAALVVITGVALLGGVRTWSARRSWQVTAGVCTCVVALPWLSVKYVPVAATLAVLTGIRLLRAGRRGQLVVGAAVLAVSGLTYLGLHQMLYGGWTVYAAGDHFVATGELSVVGVDPSYAGRARRLVGLLVDRGFGIATWAPAWLLLPAAVGVLVRTRQRDRWLLLAPLGVGWATATFVALTMHGWWVPGRQLVVVLPLAAVTVAVLTHRLPRLRPLVWAALLAGASSWVWLAREATTGVRTLVVDFTATSAPAYRAMAAVTPDGQAGGPAADIGLLVWGLLLAAGATVAVRLLPSTTPTSTDHPAEELARA